MQKRQLDERVVISAVGKEGSEGPGPAGLPAASAAILRPGTDPCCPRGKPRIFRLTDAWGL